MSPDNLPNGVEIEPVAHDVVGFIWSTFAVKPCPRYWYVLFSYAIFYFDSSFVYYKAVKNAPLQIWNLAI